LRLLSGEAGVIALKEKCEVKRFYILLILFIFNVPAYADETLDEIHKLLGWVETANPVLDAEKALKKGETKLWALQGIGIYIPGVEQEKYKKITNELGYKILEGTSDSVYGEEHLRLIRLAEKYAKIYNAYILSNYKQ
jgi:hypothetical protein